MMGVARLLGLLVLALPLGAAPVRWFSWYSYPWKHESHVPLNGSLANLAAGADPAALAAEPLPGMLMLPGDGPLESTPFLLYNSSGGRAGGSWLVRDWRSRAAAVAAAVRAHPSIVGVQLGDELVCKGLPLSNLSAVASELRARLPPSTFLYTNECFETGDPCATAASCKGSGAGPATCAGGYCQPAACAAVPPAIDYVSLDAYAARAARRPSSRASSRDTSSRA